MISRPTILIVEDDELWQSIMREPLEDEGYDVLSASFTDFGASETFTFSVDVDPTSIKDVTGSGNAGSRPPRPSGPRRPRQSLRPVGTFA